MALAKDAATTGDMILSEQYRQYADHYMRLQNIAIENENALRAQKEAQQAALAPTEAPATEDADTAAESKEEPTPTIAIEEVPLEAITEIEPDTNLKPETE